MNIEQMQLKRKAQHYLEEQDQYIHFSESKKVYIQEQSQKYFPSIFTSQTFLNTNKLIKQGEQKCIETYLQSLCKQISRDQFIMYQDHTNILQRMKQVAQIQEQFMERNQQQMQNLKSRKSSGVSILQQDKVQRKQSQKLQKLESLNNNQESNSNLDYENTQQQQNPQYEELQQSLSSIKQLSSQSSSYTVVDSKKYCQDQSQQKQSMDSLDNLETQSIENQKSKKQRRQYKLKKTKNCVNNNYVKKQQQISVNQFPSTDSDESSSTDESSEQQNVRDINIEQLFNDSTCIFEQQDNYQRIKKKSVFGDDISFEFLNLPETINNYDFENLEAC